MVGRGGGGGEPGCLSFLLSETPRAVFRPMWILKRMIKNKKKENALRYQTCLSLLTAGSTVLLPIGRRCSTPSPGFLQLASLADTLFCNPGSSPALFPQEVPPGVSQP